MDRGPLPMYQLDNKHIELIGELIENVYEDIERNHNDTVFCNKKGYQMVPDISLEDQKDIERLSKEKLLLLDDLKERLLLNDNFTTTFDQEEEEIKIQ